MPPTKMVIEINNKKYKFPETLSDFTFEQYEKVLKAKSDVEALCSVAGLPITEIRKLKKKQVDELFIALESVVKQFADIPKIQIPKKIGKYKLPTDFDTIEYGMYESVSHYIKQITDYTAASPYVCAVLSGAETGEETEKRVTYFKQQKFIDIYTYTAFFLTSDKHLYEDFRKYLRTLTASIPQLSQVQGTT